MVFELPLGWSSGGTLVRIVFISLLLLTSCGKPVCIGTFGNCSEANKKPVLSNGTTAGVGGPLRFAQDTPRTLSPGSTYQFRAEGGAGPYTFYLSSGNGNMQPSGFYTAPMGVGSTEQIGVWDRDRNAVVVIPINIQNP